MARIVEILDMEQPDLAERVKVVRDVSAAERRSKAVDQFKMLVGFLEAKIGRCKTEQLIKRLHAEYFRRKRLGEASEKWWTIRQK